MTENKMVYSWTESGKIIPKLQNKIIFYVIGTLFKIGFFSHKIPFYHMPERMSLMDYPDTNQVLNTGGNLMSKSWLSVLTQDLCTLEETKS